MTGPHDRPAWTPIPFACSGKDGAAQQGNRIPAERCPRLSLICPSCAADNPADHSFCHLCGERLAVANTPSATRPPDESRLPPPGSFRSGVYRVARAALMRQGKPEAVRQPRRGTRRIDGVAPDRGAASIQRPEREQQLGKPVATQPPSPQPVAATSHSGADPTSAANWLSMAFLAKRLLPSRGVEPARLPAPLRGRPETSQRPRVVPLAGLAGGSRNSATGPERHWRKREIRWRRAKELVVSRSVEVGAVVSADPDCRVSCAPGISPGHRWGFTATRPNWPWRPCGRSAARVSASGQE